MKNATRIRQIAWSLFVMLSVLSYQTAAFAQIAATLKTKLEEGTQIRLKLMESLHSNTAQAGQTISFEVLDNVKVGEAIVIAEGAPAWGTIVEAEGRKSMGRAGKLAYRLDYVKSVDGSKIPLRATAINQGKGRGDATGVAVAASAILFWPAAPIFLFAMKGKNVEIPRGQHIAAFVDGDRLVAAKGVAETSGELNNTVPVALSANMSNTPGVQYAALPVNQTAPVVIGNNAAALGGVNVTSHPDGAEIEIDGVFYGNTPGIVKLPAGLHTIKITRNGYELYQRSISVAPGSSLTLRAELQPLSRQVVRYQK